jgi:uncharacterized protein (TIGR03435 family)
MLSICRISTGLAALFAAGLQAQTPNPRPAFEVASIKPNNTASGHHGSDGSRGQIAFENMPLLRLIARAYDVQPFQVSGPDWLASEFFDIVAKYPAGATNEERAGMLRTLLEDRFKLAVHRESKEMPGYALVVAKSGFKLKPVDTGEHDTDHSGGRIQTLSAKATSMAFLADLLSRYLGQPVADRTGIEGVYNFEMRWSTDDQNADGAARDAPPSIYTALQENLGLRLASQKVPAEIVVVDRVERVPTDN